MHFGGDYTVATPRAGHYDSFRCFAIQTEDGAIAAPFGQWIDGFQFTPGNAAVAHHMLLYAVPNLADHMEAGLVEDPTNNSWACDGAVSRSDGSYIVDNFDLMWGWRAFHWICSGIWAYS